MTDPEEETAYSNWPKQHKYCQMKGAQLLHICQKAQKWSQAYLSKPATELCQQGVYVKSCHILHEECSFRVNFLVVSTYYCMVHLTEWSWST